MGQHKVAVVTGSSSGIGLETSLMLARNGFTTYATMRNLSKSSTVKEPASREGLPLQVVQLDVTDERSVKSAIEKIAKEAGRIDVLVNNAGYGLFGAVEDLSMEELKAQYETNFFGLVRVTQAVIPVMRKNRAGVIVNISSLAGRVGFPTSPAYTSTKFAIEGLSEAMAYELEPFGIKVVVIEPGMIKTNMMSAIVMAKKAAEPSSPYAQFMQKMSASIGPVMENAAPATEVARAVLAAVTSPNPEFRYLVGEDARMLVQAKSGQPDRAFQQMIKKNFRL